MASLTNSTFDPIAATLHAEILRYHEQLGRGLTGAAGQSTLETNSSQVAARGLPLVDMLRRRGIDSLQGLDVVDLGCGYGALALLFAAHGARVTAVDPASGRFDVGRAAAKRHDVPVEFVAGRMERLDLPDAAFDVAVQNNTLCFVVAREDRERALGETLRVLRPGGALLTRNPNRWHPVDLFTRLPLLHLLPPATAGHAARRLGRQRSLVRLTSARETRRELEGAGFTAVQQHHGLRDPRAAPIDLVARYHHFTALRRTDC